MYGTPLAVTERNVGDFVASLIDQPLEWRMTKHAGKFSFSNVRLRISNSVYLAPQVLEVLLLCNNMTTAKLAIEASLSPLRLRQLLLWLLAMGYLTRSIDDIGNEHWTRIQNV